MINMLIQLEGKSAEQVKKSTLDFFVQSCVPQVKFGIWLKLDQDKSRDS